MNIDPKEVFGREAHHYHARRLEYADADIDRIINETKLMPGTMIADIGAGSGILGRKFLEKGMQVVFVEPNRNMRDQCAVNLKATSIAPNRYKIIDGIASASGLEARSLDLITIGDALHWFEPASAATKEFRRILKPEGKMVSIRRLPDAQNLFIQALNSFLINHAEAYSKGQRFIKVSGNSANLPLLENAQRFFSPDFVTYSRKIPVQYSIDQFMDYLRTVSSIADYISDDDNKTEMKKFLQSQVNEHGVIAFDWEVRVCIGTPRKYKTVDISNEVTQLSKVRGS